MNIGRAFSALGEGLELQGRVVAGREQAEWEAARQENLVRLRAKFEAEQTEKNQKFTAAENAAERTAADRRAERADDRADSRMNSQERMARERENRIASREDKAALRALRVNRSTGLQKFATEINAVRKNLLTAQQDGNESEAQELRAELDLLARQRENFDLETQYQLSEAGDPYWRDSTLDDDQMNRLFGGDGATGGDDPADPDTAPAVPSAPQLIPTEAPKPKPKPQQRIGRGVIGEPVQGSARPASTQDRRTQWGRVVADPTEPEQQTRVGGRGVTLVPRLIDEPRTAGR